tara:strand:- start:728 stop:1339 length:612 start_codon:yes stop_codon:yes gene_type:complete
MDIRSGIIHLKKSDKRFANIINQYPEPSIKKTTNFFQSLTKYIIYQQLSTKSAAAIYSRFIQLFKSVKIKPNHVLSIPKDDLKLIGLSKQKINYILLLAKNWPETNKELKNIDLLTDDDIGNKLMKHKGIGQWTVDMFLIFSLARPDVFPTGDLVIQKGYAKLYNMINLPNKNEMLKGAEKWKPYRTLACLYLWDMIDGPFQW